jgi:hypothetical protein
MPLDEQGAGFEARFVARCFLDDLDLVFVAAQRAYMRNSMRAQSQLSVPPAPE